MQQALAGRTIDGVEYPAPGVYAIDTTHSAAAFSVRHLMVGKVRGRFGGFSATITVGEALEESRVEAVIDAASIDTGEPGRDAHLRSPDFLDVENHPSMSFVSTGFRRTAANSFELPGDLTIRGVTRQVVLRVEYDGVALDTDGNTRAGFTATAEIDREEFGLTWNVALEAGGVMVGKRIKVELDIEAVRSA